MRKIFLLAIITCLFICCNKNKADEIEKVDEQSNTYEIKISSNMDETFTQNNEGLEVSCLISLDNPKGKAELNSTSDFWIITDNKEFKTIKVKVSEHNWDASSYSNILFATMFAFKNAKINARAESLELVLSYGGVIQDDIPRLINLSIIKNKKTVVDKKLIVTDSLLFETIRL